MLFRSKADRATVIGTVSGGALNDILDLNTSGYVLSYKNSNVGTANPINSTGNSSLLIKYSPNASEYTDYLFTQPAIRSALGSIIPVITTVMPTIQSIATSSISTTGVTNSTVNSSSTSSMGSSSPNSLTGTDGSAKGNSASPPTSNANTGAGSNSQSGTNSADESVK